MHEWFQTPPGRYLLEWERAQFDRAVADIFGYHALQLGMPDLDALGSNRMPHRWLALDAAGFAASGGTAAVEPTGSRDEVGDTAAASRLALRADYAALPFPERSLDLVVLPHTLELNVDPHATLREVDRVLVPEGAGGDLWP